MDFASTLVVSASGMDAQSQRLRVIAENLANQDTTGSTPGADPYRRKTITFSEALNDETGASEVGVERIGRDERYFETRFDPRTLLPTRRVMSKSPMSIRWWK